VVQPTQANSRAGMGFVWYLIIVTAWAADAILAAGVGPHDPSHDVLAHTPLEWRLRAAVWVLAAILLAALAIWRPARDPACRLVQKWGLPLFLVVAAADWLESLQRRSWVWSIPLVVGYVIVLAWLAGRQKSRSFISRGGLHEVPKTPRSVDP
jgi:hypothetical protein